MLFRFIHSEQVLCFWIVRLLFRRCTYFPSHRIVLIEGLYTFLSISPWNEAGILLDERWYLKVDIDEAKRRLVKRHVLTGVTKDWDEAVLRAEENDMPSEWILYLDLDCQTDLYWPIDF